MQPVRASNIRFFSGDDVHLAPQRVAGTGTTEAHNPVALPLGRMATLIVGATPLRIMLRSDHSLADGVVATTDPVIAAYSHVTWTVDIHTQYLYAEAADGSSAYECWVYLSSI